MKIRSSLLLLVCISKYFINWCRPGRTKNVLTKLWGLARKILESPALGYLLRFEPYLKRKNNKSIGLDCTVVLNLLSNLCNIIPLKIYNIVVFFFDFTNSHAHNNVKAVTALVGYCTIEKSFIKDPRNLAGLSKVCYDYCLDSKTNNTAVAGTTIEL